MDDFRLLFPILLAVLVSPRQAYATSALYPVVVLNANGDPCFTLDAGHFRLEPQFAAIEVTAEPNDLMWEMHSLTNVSAMKFSSERDCILYGRLYKGHSSVSAAKTLFPGHLRRCGLLLGERG